MIGPKLIAIASCVFAFAVSGCVSQLKGLKSKSQNANSGRHWWLGVKALGIRGLSSW